MCEWSEMKCVNDWNEKTNSGIYDFSVINIPWASVGIFNKLELDCYFLANFNVIDNYLDFTQAIVVPFFSN
jgi:hypothetical protein